MQERYAPLLFLLKDLWSYPGPNSPGCCSEGVKQYHCRQPAVPAIFINCQDNRAMFALIPPWLITNEEQTHVSNRGIA